MGNQFAEMTALFEQVLRMRFLKILAPNLRAGNMRRDRQNRHSTPLTVIKTVDEMKVTRSTASGAHGQFTGDVRLGTGRKGCNLFVS
jgi:hypothetical protein